MLLPAHSPTGEVQTTGEASSGRQSQASRRDELVVATKISIGYPGGRYSELAERLPRQTTSSSQREPASSHVTVQASDVRHRCLLSDGVTAVSGANRRTLHTLIM